MQAKITKIFTVKGKNGQDIYIICFKSIDGKSYRTWTGEEFGNFQRWINIIRNFKNSNNEIWLDNLVLKGKNLIDADSLFYETRKLL